MYRRRALLSLVAAVMFIAGACGSDEVSGSTTTTAADVPASDASTSDTVPPVDDSQPPNGQDRSAELVGRWEVVNYSLPDNGALTNVVGDDPVYIEFGAGGTVSYHTGCNPGGTGYTTSGTYAVPESALDDIAEGQAITFGPVFEQEEQGCDGFLGDQDRDLPADMGATTRFILDGDRLLLLEEFLLIEATRAG